MKNRHPLSRLVGWLLMLATSIGPLCAQAPGRQPDADGPLPGSRPGTERWIVLLRDRGRYGTLVGRSLTQIGSVGYQALVGRSPIAALITEEPAPQQLQPRLQVWGEPLIGRSIELQGEAFPPNSLVVLYSGTWAPFSAAVLSCSQHVVSVGSSFWAVSDAEGHVRWDLQSGSTNPVFALNPALLGQVVGLQAVVPSTLGLSSALRLGIGGGL